MNGARAEWDSRRQILLETTSVFSLGALSDVCVRNEELYECVPERKADVQLSLSFSWGHSSLFRLERGHSKRTLVEIVRNELIDLDP